MLKLTLKPLTLLWILCGLLVLIPLSIDNLWNVSFFDYDARVNYVGAALTLLLAAVTFKRKLFDLITSYFKDRWALAFLAMTGAGVLGTIHSHHLTRSIFFLVWSMGTLFMVPFLIHIFVRVFPTWAARAFVLYLGVQSLIILLDAAICIPSNGKFKIARAMIYQAAGAGTLCRPHAWYQEPGYFAAFGLLALIIARVWLGIEKSKPWKKLTLIVVALTPFAIIATTSRLGWLGIAGLFAYEMVTVLKQKSFPNFRKSIAANKIATWSVVVSMAALVTVAFLKWNDVYYYVGRGVVSPTEDGSFQYRYGRVVAAMQVFKDNPWVGAGPGAAGAYWMDVYGRDKQNDPAYVLFRRDPLSQNLYTELLSEWGLLGTVFFLIGLALILNKMPPHVKLQVGFVLAMIYLSNQTLPRFDLWAELGLVLALSRQDRKSTGAALQVD